MPDRVLPGPVESSGNGCCPADSVNVHTNKIYDACREKE